MLKPLFKWTGGKNRMRQKYEDIFWPDRSFDRFIDCFYGAGAISHWVHERYPNTEFVINDFNSEMVSIYKQLALHPDDFIDMTLRLCEEFNAIEGKENRKSFYNKLKMAHIQDYEKNGELRTGVNLHWMMKNNFNGWWKIYSYSNGRYATPPGVMNDCSVDVANLKNTAKFLKDQCTILTGDFEGVSPYVSSTSFVYFDPPYRDSTTNYTDDGFNEFDQERLCAFFDKAVNKGAVASLSNKEIGDGFFEKHLGKYNIHKMPVKYTAGRGTTTNDVQEVLVTSYEPVTQTTLMDFAC